MFFFFLTLDLIQTDVFLPSYVMIFKISLGCLKNVKPSFSRISLWESGHPCAMFSWVTCCPQGSHLALRIVMSLTFWDLDIWRAENRVMLAFLPFKPEEWLWSNFSMQQHLRIIHSDHENDPQPKKLWLLNKFKFSVS